MRHGERMYKMKKSRYSTLTKLRKQNHLSMVDIANQLDISTAYYCQLETKKKRLSYEMAIRIANVFHLMPDDIFFDDEKESLK